MDCSYHLEIYRQCHLNWFCNNCFHSIHSVQAAAPEIQISWKAWTKKVGKKVKKEFDKGWSSYLVVNNHGYILFHRILSIISIGLWRSKVCIFSCFPLPSSLDSLGEIGLIPMKKPRAWNTLEPVGPLLPLCDATIIKIHRFVSQRVKIAVWRRYQNVPVHWLVTM